MRRFLFHIACWLFAALPIVAAAQDADAQDIADAARRVHRLHRDALPQTTAYNMEVDTRGWVWIATQSGVAYFNGRRWQKLDAFSEAVANELNQGRRIIAAPDGAVWFAPSYGGLYRLAVRPGVPFEHWRWTQETTKDGLPSDSVTTLLVRQDGSLLAATSNGVAIRVGDLWRPLPMPPGAAFLSVRSLAETQDGTIWIGTRQGLWSMRDGAWHAASLPDGIAERRIDALYESRDGRLWIATSGGLAVLNPALDRWRRLPAESLAYTTIVEQEDGTMWFGTVGPRHGIVVLRPDGSRHRIGMENGLPSEDILSLLVHPDGTRWIGTRNGIALYSGNEWGAIDRTTGLAGEYVWAIAEGARDAFWFGTDHGVSIYEQGRWRRPSGPAGADLTDIRVIHPMDDGTTYLANRSALYAHRDGRVRVVSRLPTRQRIYSSAEHDGELLLGTSLGVQVLRAGELVRYGDYSHSDKVAKALLSARDGALWVSVMREGVMRIGPRGDTQLYTLAHGLPADDVLSLYEDDLGLVWAATVDGLAIFDGRRWRTISDTTAVRLPDSFVYSVLQDAQHRYYVSTNRGVLRLTRSVDASKDVDALMFDAVQYYGPGEGLPSYEANLGAAHRDRRGRIWFGTVAGAAVYDPSETFAAKPAAPLVIETVSFEQLPDSALVAHDPSAGPLELSHRQRNVSFVFTLGAVSQPEGIRYRTQLLGYGAQTAWAPEARRTFTNLPAGDYVFRVWGRTRYGVESGPVDFAFNVAAAPWASWWAFFGYSLCFLLLVAGIVRWQTMRLHRAHLHEADMLQERLSRQAAEAQAAHLRDENRRLAEDQFRDDMIRMLVHDLRSPLSIMQMVAREISTDGEMPRETVGELSSLVVETSDQALRLVDLILDVSRLEAGRMPVVLDRVVLPEAAGQALSSLWPLADEKGISLEANIAPDLPLLHADRRLLDRILANLLGNAIKFTPREGTVRLSAHTEGTVVELRVSDTGPGIPPALRPRLFQKFASGNAEGSGSGLGLAFCRLAAEAMGGRIRMASSGEGATFILSFPSGSEAAPQLPASEPEGAPLPSGDGSSGTVDELR